MLTLNLYKMKKLLLVLMFLPMGVLSQEDLRTISGSVSDEFSPLQNVTINVNNSEEIAVSDKDGKYRIMASAGDELVFTYTGKKTVRIKLEDVTRILNVTLYQEVQELDEVVVTKSNRKSQEELAIEYSSNKRLIKTAWGILDADTAPGRIWMLNEDSIMPVGICILDVLRNEFSGVQVSGDCRIGGNVEIRGRNSMFLSNSAIYDIDGQIFVNTPLWLDVNNIKRIAILGNFPTTVKYGGLGNGGVVVINTISGNTFPKNNIDYARLKNNFYDNNALNFEQVLKNAPVYLQELQNTKTFDEAQEVFENFEDNYGQSQYFLIDAIHFFTKNWPNEGYGIAIYENNQRLIDGNAMHLKSIAYAFEAAGLNEEAHEIYKKVFILRPNYAQSYIDLANSYRVLKESKMAATMFTRYNYLVDEGFMDKDITSLSTIMEREYNNLLSLMGDQVVGKRSSELFVEPEDFEGTRLVFEWSDGEAEFDLQFVNPQNQYEIWHHGLEKNAERIADEKEVGFSMQEYLIDESLRGTWQVNVMYLGNKKLTPSYLKATIYHNYGSAAQRKEVKLFKLSLTDVNQKLFTISNTSTVVSN